MPAQGVANTNRAPHSLRGLHESDAGPWCKAEGPGVPRIAAAMENTERGESENVEEAHVEAVGVQILSESGQLRQDRALQHSGPCVNS